MAQLPAWAKAPGPDWHHRENYSDVDVVWYHEPGVEGVIYQFGPGEYAVAGTVEPAVSRRRWFWHRVVLVSASVAAAVGVGMHFLPWR